ncbi:cytochrome c nitrite reductase small subunit [Alistipes sp. ZOR0009]|uniref:cytochrome c nitrite reductase small subunit n=1 Tax=Alistipes sp. ZOR0009 TaxID=1339253 RepID=UPI0006491B1A|nr:cytochrome c nitrite reductase small subunit [Alistipes sp. ZOR0009]
MKLLKKILPPPQWRVAVIVALGVFSGLGCYTFYVSKAYSYLSDKPEVCVNCHIMGTQYATWFHSSHRERATCNDCHVPHSSALMKYAFKAKDGMRHAALFTLRLEHQSITIGDAGASVVQQNCIRCHTVLNQDVGLAKVTFEMAKKNEGKVCWECHREVPHGRMRSLSSTPNAIVPLPESPVPDWLNELMASKKK